MDLSDSRCFDAVDAASDASTSAPSVSPREFLVANYARLQRRLCRHLGCPDLASDCLHDAWLRLSERLPVPATRHPEAYVYRVACNLAIDRLRGNRAGQQVDDAEVVLAGFADPAPGPERIAEVRSDMAALEQAIERLPRRQRAVLLALRLEEMSRDEVAGRYRMSLRNVDTALRQALDRCRA
ncbi:RNA polymerase sigma factor [Variovorax sp.]|jgi:RNA polymerase sigma factor (sigma-70 family)|uniref:RNA polymerase sigma factor n=1 Tax=Variovorax sp. TaxID=1871043 RepID=UPI0037DA4556